MFPRVTGEIAESAVQVQDTVPVEMWNKPANRDMSEEWDGTARAVSGPSPPRFRPRAPTGGGPGGECTGQRRIPLGRAVSK